MHEQYEKLNGKRQLKDGNPRDAGNSREKDDTSKWLGYEQGKKTQLNCGVNGKESAKLGYKNESEM